MYKSSFLQPFIQDGKFNELCMFVQDQENQLWDGHPYIYPNLRIFLEEWCDFIIKEWLKLEIIETDDGKTRKDIHVYYNELVKQKRVREALAGKKLIVKRNEWSFALKIRTVEEAFREIGINTDNHFKAFYRATVFKSALISENPNEAYVQFFERFDVLKKLHDGVYKDYLEVVFQRKIELYVMPNEKEIMEMVERYYNRHCPKLM